MPHVKTAFSLPEAVFTELEAEATRTHRSRSAIASEALTAYLKRLEDERFTEELNAAVDKIPEVEWEAHLGRLSHSAYVNATRLSEEDGGWPSRP